MIKPIDSNSLYSPFTLKFHFKPVLVFLTVSVVSMAIALWIDFPIYHLAPKGKAYDDFVSNDLYRMLRVMGFLPVWLIVALALILHDMKFINKVGRGPAAGRGLLLVITTITSGLFAEIVKITVRRLRPPKSINVLDFDPTNSLHLYRFRAWEWDWSTLKSSGLGFPSSHVIIAFAAAFTLARLFPRAAIIWYALAIGCSLTRILTLGHFVSDAVAAALIAFAVTRFYWFWHLYNQRELIKENHGFLPIM